ncbi:hypothetical protein YC2023_040550 [Brassica napus]
MNLYYQSLRVTKVQCDFSGTGTEVNVEPSHGPKYILINPVKQASLLVIHLAILHAPPPPPPPPPPRAQALETSSLLDLSSSPGTCSRASSTGLLSA